MSAARDKRVAEAFKLLCHKAHVYHGATKLDPPSEARKEAAKTDLGLAAVRLAHALAAPRVVDAASGLDPLDAENPCACEFCAAAATPVRT